MKITLNCVFKNPKGEQKTALIFLNRTSDESWYSRSIWVGRTVGGDTESASFWHPEIYLKDGKDSDMVVGHIKGIGIDDIVRDIGDTGTGKLYSGASGRYPIPLDFNWEVVEAQGKSTIGDDRGPVD
jgi:hypothetical protein